MDHRFFFAAGDLFSNLILGAVIGLLCALVIVAGWNIWLVMILAMVAGLIISLIFWFPLSLVFGAIELMVSLILTGMIAGAVTGMIAAIMILPLIIPIVIGAFCGVVCINVIWLLNQYLRDKHQ